MTAQRFLALAEPLDGPYVARFRALARRLRVWLLAPFAEREGDAVYNTALLLAADGTVAGRYRKTHVQSGGDWRYYAPANPSRSSPPPGARWVMICYDRQFPEVPRALRGPGRPPDPQPLVGHVRRPQRGDDAHPGARERRLHPLRPRPRAPCCSTRGGRSPPAASPASRCSSTTSTSRRPTPACRQGSPHRPPAPRALRRRRCPLPARFAGPDAPSPSSLAAATARPADDDHGRRLLHPRDLLLREQAARRPVPAQPVRLDVQQDAVPPEGRRPPPADDWTVDQMLQRDGRR